VSAYLASVGNGGASPSVTRPAASLRNIRRSFVTASGLIINAISNITLDLADGEVVALIGPSGCGKSSLLRILAGLDEDFDGSLDLDSNATARSATRLSSATVFQGDSTMPWMNVDQNIRLGMSGLSLDKATLQSRIDHYRNLVGLNDFGKSYPNELSGGMRQRVAIARALSTEPLLLLMDEPLSALDAQTRLVMQQELLDIWSKARSTVVYVTHDISEAITLANRIVVLTSRPGSIKEIHPVPFGTNRDVLDLRQRPEFGKMEAALWRLVADEVGQKL